MTSTFFNALLERRIHLIQSVLAAKESEYATGRDRLHNFKRAAAMLDETPGDACIGFMAKHLVSIFDMVDDKASGLPVPTEKIEEKIGDAINYLILLEAILKE